LEHAVVCLARFNNATSGQFGGYVHDFGRFFKHKDEALSIDFAIAQSAGAQGMLIAQAAYNRHLDGLSFQGGS
jgi:hypothetical protein